MSSFTISSLPTAVGVELGSSDWVSVDQARIDTFANATGDQQWIHVDQQRAVHGPFGTTIAHGYLTLSLISALMDDILVVADATTVINYGLDKVRFPALVPSGSRLRACGTVIAVIAVPDGYRVTTRVKVEAEGRGKPVCVADVVAWYVGEAKGR